MGVARRDVLWTGFALVFAVMNTSAGLAMLVYCSTKWVALWK